MSGTITTLQKLDKRHVEATVNFAVGNIPQADPDTLEKFLELVNATGNYGPISTRQLLRTMQILVKYVPNVCNYSLIMLAELLGIYPAQAGHYNFDGLAEDRY